MPLTEAGKLVEQIWRELAGLGERIRKHPWVAAVEAGQAPEESLKQFAGHQFHIIASDLRSVALLVHRHGTLPSRGFLSGILQGESEAYEASLEFASALGLSREWLDSFEPQPSGVAYAWCVNWLATYGSDAELTAAFLVNFPAWGANCGRLARGLEAFYGIKKPALRFFELFAASPPEFEEAALDVIQAGLDRGVPPRLVRRAARLLQGCELMYWDMLAAG